MFAKAEQRQSILKAGNLTITGRLHHFKEPALLLHCGFNDEFSERSVLYSLAVEK